jgi:hypothetical protein
VTGKRLTVILFGSDRNLWSGGPLRIRVTDVFAAGGPKLLHQGTTESSTLDLELQLPFDAGQIYGFDFTAPDHHPAWQLVRRSDFIRMPEGIEGDDVILRLMLVPDTPGTRDLSQGFQRLQEKGSPLAAPGAGLEDDTFQELGVANRMALLNIESKLRETFVDGTSLLSFVKAVRHVAVDRLFLLVDAGLKERLKRSRDFAGAPGHPAPSIPASTPAHPDSWKHRLFAEGNVQLSFSADATPSPDGGAGLVHSVDVDIDLGKGLAHVVEWLDNNVIRRGHKTDQVLIYGLLYAQRILPLYTLDPVRATTARSARLLPPGSAKGRQSRSAKVPRSRSAKVPPSRSAKAKPSRTRRKKKT